MLKKYFSGESQTLSLINIFPQQDVYNVLKVSGIIYVADGIPGPNYWRRSTSLFLCKSIAWTRYQGHRKFSEIGLTVDFMDFIVA